MCKNLHNVLVSLNTVCMQHARRYNYKQPNVSITYQDTKKMNTEINKLLNYLKHPYYSYLQK
jgi:hypothetical protein